MCGIFGGSAIKGSKLNSYKLKILGLFNDRRGGDSSGYYYNGNIVKGAGFHDSLFSDLVIKHDLVCGELDCEVFIGHTRKATSGATTEANAHPFEVENYVQVHNGRIENIWPLCNKYKINHASIHVDSLGLAHIIQENGFEVLNEYKGYAALAFTFTDDPNSLYLFKGASRDKAKDEFLTVERPLFFLNQKEGFYFSSIEESLDYINDDPDEIVYSLKENTVFKISEGKITDFRFKVNRSEMNLFTPLVVPPKSTSPPLPSVNESLIKPTSNEIAQQVVSKIIFNDLIFKEQLPSACYISKVYYINGRYVNGLGNLLDGIIKIDRNRSIINENSINSNMNEEFYFVMGVMMRDLQHYNEAKKLNINSDIHVALLLSRHSKYPVICKLNEGKHIKDIEHRYSWFRDGTLIKKVFAFNAKFSDYRYMIEAGRTKEINLNIQEVK